ncbi:MAG: DUF1559 domain-containing protein, partial [Pirellulales bacterium]
YAVSTGSTICFAPNIPGLNMPPHNGAIVHPVYGTITLAKIVDGTSQTMLVGEMNYGLTNYYWGGCKPPKTIKGGETRWAVAYPGVTWASATGRMNSTTQMNSHFSLFFEEYEAFRSDHAGGVNFAFVDGSVRFLTEGIELGVYQALATRDGGETIDSVGN